MHKDAEQTLTYLPKIKGTSLPHSVRTKELICSSSSGGLGSKIGIKRVKGWVTLKRGQWGRRIFKTFTNMTVFSNVFNVKKTAS